MTQPVTDRPLQGWTIVFDLDGTLVESAPDLLGALNHTLATRALAPVSLDHIRTMIGEGARAMITKALNDAAVSLTPPELEQLWRIFIVHYRDNIAVESHLFEGASQALDELAALGASLCVCTNKPQDLSEQVLDALGVRMRFAAIVGADRVTSKKPDGRHILATLEAAAGDPSRAIMVGDSRTDERAARDAGLPFIFVTFGYEVEPASAMRADAVVSDYRELVGAVHLLVS